MAQANPALTAFGQALAAHGYEFTTVTPLTHERVVQNRRRPAQDVRDVFGWNLTFSRNALPGELFDLAFGADLLVSLGEDQFRSAVRVATVNGQLFIHSSFPTTDADAVFFGPDSYRFCNLLARALPPCTRLVDVGCGSGVGGLYARGKAQQLVLADINPRALHFAAANAAIAGVNARVVKSDVLASIEGPVDAIIANPPYMHDAAGRTYRDGGGQLGEGLALRIVRQALDRLQPGGTLVLYTGSAIVDGDDYFKHEALALCQSAGAAAEYSELDPDVFGEELDQPAYSNVERIAAVALIARTPSYPKHTYV